MINKLNILNLHSTLITCIYDVVILQPVSYKAKIHKKYKAVEMC